ncbi:serine/threonine protein kinase [Paenibacillus sp. SYP-B3998]|uniref:Serine/threonine protein kinase n=1 Tax=Paenibacillus sp. SYP-B3998 TaxID=2678564 RepID=A0A6G4A7M9_9BACL|nr:serine/threonine-protein kinase [Paenibacillus sp. SYP-B3998]NEW09809.1 serine/threonine protein kinase [Paenibacillus sp. SYP-B3998]
MNQENHCGNHLQINSLLNDTYKLTGYMASSELSIVYLGCHIESGEVVVIKEYYPQALAMRDMDNRTVIYKMQSSKAKFDKLRDAFRKEALILQQLRHKNIVGYINDFEQNGTNYLVTSYCKGQTLESSILADNPMAMSDRLKDTLIPLLEAIEYMHGHGIIHRDLKPGNVIMLEDGSPQLIDFGSALIPDKGSKYPIMTSVGFSPLELYSEKSAQGKISDIFSFAAIIYKVLTGHAPMDVSQRLFQDDIPSVRALNKRVGFVLSSIIMWGLAVKSAQRCPSLRLMKAALYVEYYRLKCLELRIGKSNKKEKPNPRL